MPSLLVVLDTGEWGAAAIGLGLAFLVAAIGVFGLGYWVIRGDSRNRKAELSDTAEGVEHH